MSREQDCVVVNTCAEREICEKVGRSVRGLMDADQDVMPHLSAEVACCSHRICPDNLADDVVSRQLSESKTSNWCRTARSLIPLRTNGPDNCLDVACALALWGVSLPASLLRRLVYVTLVEFGESKYLNRWRKQRDSDVCNDESIQRGDDVWDEVVKSAQPHQHDASLHYSCGTASFSDAVQVFALANILRRSVVVLSSMSDSDSEPHRESEVGGIYLPLLWSPNECVHSPLVLAYISGQFIPLVGGDSVADMPSALDIVPLVTSQLVPLPVWFLLDGEEHEVFELMQRYMSVTEVNLCQADSISMVLGARLKYQPIRDVQLNSAASLQQHLTELHISHIPQTGPVEGTSSGTTHPAVTTPIDLSVTMTQCRAPNCTNLASSFIYPYCYEHIDQRIVESTVAQRQQQATALPQDTSLMPVGCQQSGCPNMCSVFVYPFCYEHIESKISQHHASAEQPCQEYLMSISPDDCIHPGCTNRASVHTYPVCYQHLDFFSQQQQQQQSVMPASRIEEPAVNGELQQSSPVYEKMMLEIETRTKGTAARCRSVDCRNYGNGRCQGYCHECYRILQETQQY